MAQAWWATLLVVWVGLASCSDGDDTPPNLPDSGLDAAVPDAAGGDPLADGSGRSDAAARQDEDAGNDPDPDPEDAGASATDRACLPYTDAWLDVSPPPDARYSAPERWGTTTVEIALTWRADVPGLYLVHAEGDNAAFSVSVLRGGCEGERLRTEAAAYDALEGAFRPVAGETYAFVARSEPIRRSADRPIRVRLHVSRVCDTDDASACATGTTQEPACGLVVADPTTGDPYCVRRDVPGEIDDRCPDTNYEGARVEGCCRTDGICGHMDAELGCHRLAQRDWAYYPEQLVFYCDERAADAAPEFFECSSDVCETALDCCAHYNYGNAHCIEGACVPREECADPEDPSTCWTG